ncbi:MAG: lamin tail domain-containing protein, partial [Patescibacteria group bacterium]
MGSPAASAGAASANEWFELKNNSGHSFDLRGVRVQVGDGDILATASEKKIVPSGGFALFERSDDDSVPNIPAEVIYSGALSNSGARLKIFGADCRLLDEIDARSGWPAGEAATKHTMSRRADLSWFASVEAGGTPKKENTPPIGGATSPPSASSSQTTPPPPTLRTLSLVVQKESGATGAVLGSGLDCASDCAKTFSDGTHVSLSATASTGSIFTGWSGSCSGASGCDFDITSDVTVTASFALIPIPPPTPTSTPPLPGQIVITEVMVGKDGASTDEFVELYNVGGTALDLTGWIIKKRSSTGNESALVVTSRLTGKSIPPGKHFLLGNEGGYAGAVPPDAFWAPSNVLAHTNNAVIL